jgi:hypothetical protein
VRAKITTPLVGVDAMHEVDLAIAEAEQLFERANGAIARRLRRHAGRLVHGDPVGGFADDLELRIRLDHRDSIIVFDFA